MSTRSQETLQTDALMYVCITEALKVAVKCCFLSPRQLIVINCSLYMKLFKDSNTAYSMN